MISSTITDFHSADQISPRRKLIDREENIYALNDALGVFAHPISHLYFPQSSQIEKFLWLHVGLLTDRERNCKWSYGVVESQQSRPNHIYVGMLHQKILGLRVIVMRCFVETFLKINSSYRFSTESEPVELNGNNLEFLSSNGQFAVIVPIFSDFEQAKFGF